VIQSKALALDITIFPPIFSIFPNLGKKQKMKKNGGKWGGMGLKRYKFLPI
jgi:hypothetical protein